MKDALQKIVATRAPGAVVLVRLALTTTKVPLLVNKGFWAMAHESRADWSMLLGSLFLLIVGAGPWSLDRFLDSRSASRK